MEKKKINFSNIKGMLSNDQMKSIKGGSVGDPGCGNKCYITLPDGNREQIGTCGTFEGTCACFTSGYTQFGSQTGCYPQ